MAGGIASTLLDAARRRGGIDGDLGLFEVDEFWLGPVAGELAAARRAARQPVPRPARPLRRARDDRRPLGGRSSRRCPPAARLVLNADDPLIADLGRERAERDLLRGRGPTRWRSPRCSTRRTPSTAAAAAPPTSTTRSTSATSATTAARPAVRQRPSPTSAREHDHAPRHRARPTFTLVTPAGDAPSCAAAAGPLQRLQRARRRRALPVPRRLARRRSSPVCRRSTAAFGRAETVRVGDTSSAAAADQEPRRRQRGPAHAGARARTSSTCSRSSTTSPPTAATSPGSGTPTSSCSPRTCARRDLLGHPRGRARGPPQVRRRRRRDRLTVVPDLPQALDAALARAAARRLFALPTYTALLALRDELAAARPCRRIWERRADERHGRDLARPRVRRATSRTWRCGSTCALAGVGGPRARRRRRHRPGHARARPRRASTSSRSTATPSCSPSSQRRAGGLPVETVARRCPRLRRSPASCSRSDHRADADDPAARRAPTARRLPAPCACAPARRRRARGRDRRREDFEEFEWHDGDAAPLPDIVERDGVVYCSQPTAVRRAGRRASCSSAGARPSTPAGARGRSSTDRIALDVAHAAERRARPARGRPASRSACATIPPTDEHIGSEVVMLRCLSRRTLRVCALYPDLMNIYADRGNLLMLERRCDWRGIGFELSGAGIGDELDPRRRRSVLHGRRPGPRPGALRRRPRRAQARRRCSAAAERGAVILGVCGGYQLLGHEYELGERDAAGRRPARHPHGPLGRAAADRQRRDRGRAARAPAADARRLRESRRPHAPRRRRAAARAGPAAATATTARTATRAPARERDRHLPARAAAAQERLVRRLADRHGARATRRAARAARRRARATSRTPTRAGRRAL